MSVFTCLITKGELAGYRGKKEEELPEGVQIIMDRASELIIMAVLRNYNKDNEEHVEVTKKACCAQCQNWIENELSPVSDNTIASYSLGELSITYENTKSLSNSLCSTAVKYLTFKHLLYKGVR